MGLHNPAGRWYHNPVAGRRGQASAGVKTITPAHVEQHRSLSLLFLALAAGLAGGLAGGLVVVVAPAGREATEEAVTPTPVATAATPEATAVAIGSAERLQQAIERVLPAIVTVIADEVPRRNEQGEVVQTRNVGSGIVIDDRGHVVTNFHVIDGAAEINVLLTTGEQRPAVVRSHDSPYSDLAVLQLLRPGACAVPSGAIPRSSCRVSPSRPSPPPGSRSGTPSASAWSQQRGASGRVTP